MFKKVAVSIGILLASVSIASCEGVKDTLGIANRIPVIASFDYSPKSGVTKNDVITFTVVANDPEGRPLQYNWTATKGILSANSGNTVSWRPLKLDGSYESGLSNVSVLVSDGVMSNTANVNIFIQENSVTVATPNTSVSPSPSVAPTAVSSPAPTVSPTAVPTSLPSATVAPTSVPTASPTATPSVEPTTTPVPTATPSQVTASPSSTVIVTQ